MNVLLHNTVNDGTARISDDVFDENEFANSIRSMSEYIDFATVSSWSEIVVLIAVNGIPLTMNVVACAAYACFRNSALAESFIRDISDDTSLWNFVGTSGFINLLFKICDDGQSLFEWSSTRGYVSGESKRAFKYKVLNAVFTRCPLPVVRYYTAHRIGLHGFDPVFISWFSNRISGIRDGKYAKLVQAVLAEIKTQRELSKFTM